ncbi:MAG: hypothetical protein V3S14_07845 [Anaerolineae bacterium]
MRWILSHALRHKLVILGLFVGALGNAVLAAVMPMQAAAASGTGLRFSDQAAYPDLGRRDQRH